MDTLHRKQSLFCLNISRLIQEAHENGEELTFGDAYRSPVEAAQNADKGIGISNSLHSLRLAIDFNLFVKGAYQPNSEAYRHLGDFWKSLHPLNRWGGDFKKPDGNHFSMEHNGVR